MKPNDTVAPVAIPALYDTFVAVAAPPDSVMVAFQAWVTVWPSGRVQVSRQPLTASPRLVMSTFAPKPPGHWLETVYTTRQPAVAADARCAPVMPAPVSARVTAAAAANNGLRRRGSMPFRTVVRPFSSHTGGPCAGVSRDGRPVGLHQVSMVVGVTRWSGTLRLGWNRPGGAVLPARLARDVLVTCPFSGVQLAVQAGTGAVFVEFEVPRNPNWVVALGARAPL